MNNVLLNNVNFSCHLQVNVVDSKWYFRTIKKIHNGNTISNQTINYFKIILLPYKLKFLYKHL